MAINFIVHQKVATKYATLYRFWPNIIIDIEITIMTPANLRTISHISQFFPFLEGAGAGLTMSTLGKYGMLPAALFLQAFQFYLCIIRACSSGGRLCGQESRVSSLFGADVFRFGGSSVRNQTRPPPSALTRGPGCAFYGRKWRNPTLNWSLAPVLHFDDGP